jgi:hypothetical protein
MDFRDLGSTMGILLRTAKYNIADYKYLRQYGAA